MQIEAEKSKKTGRIGKLGKFLPCIFVMVVIFYFSSADAETSSKTSGSIAENFAGLMYFQLDPVMLEAINGVIRKTAHFMEYMALAVTGFYACSSWVARPFYLYGGLQLFCTLYAVSDEIHQYFVPGRSCQVKDALIDSAGAAVGLLLCMLFVWIFRNKRKKCYNEKNID